MGEAGAVVSMRLDCFGNLKEGVPPGLRRIAREPPPRELRELHNSAREPPLLGEPWEGHKYLEVSPRLGEALWVAHRNQRAPPEIQSPHWEQMQNSWERMALLHQLQCNWIAKGR